MIKIESGEWWSKNSKVKFFLDKFYINEFDDLKKIFKFNLENFKLQIKNKEIKKIGYNFFVNGKKATKKDIINLFQKN